jgi:dehydrogenase/reductase SDR family protein 12
MFAAFGQFASTSQFYLYGKRHCTRTGWEQARKSYSQPDILEDPALDLSNKVYMITGANAGIGREISLFAASKGATVYMVCRNPDRAQVARDAIIGKYNNL